MMIRDVNEFVDGYEHEAQLKGTHHVRPVRRAHARHVHDRRRGQPLPLPPGQSGDGGSRDAVPHRVRQHRRPALLRSTARSTCRRTRRRRRFRDMLGDYTTLYCHVVEMLPDGSRKEIGTALMLKFRTFENLAAVGSLAAFLASFQVTGTNDPAIQLQARMRFLAFTAQFVSASTTRSHSGSEETDDATRSDPPRRSPDDGESLVRPHAGRLFQRSPTWTAWTTSSPA